MRRVTVRQIMIKKDDPFYLEDDERILEAAIRGDSGRLHVIIAKEIDVSSVYVTGTDAHVNEYGSSDNGSSGVKRKTPRKRDKPQQS